MERKHKKNNINSKIILFSSVLLVAVLIFVLFVFKNNNGPNSNPETSDAINYNTPSEVEQSSANEKKKEIVSQSATNQNNDYNANITIVDASQYGNVIEVRAFVNNVIQGGKCSITFTKDSSIVEKQSPAFADASTTPCVNLEVDRSEFDKSGEWKLIVAYSSSDGKYNGEATSVVTIK